MSDKDLLLSSKIGEINSLLIRLLNIKKEIKFNKTLPINQFQPCQSSLRIIFDKNEEDTVSKTKITEDLLKSILAMTTTENKRLIDVEFDEHSLSSVTMSTLKENFRQSQKMEAVGRMAGGIAHDFNNFLTVILGYGRMVLEELAPTNPHRPLLTTMVECAERASLLTQQLLAFSRRHEVETKTTNINSLIKNMQSLIKRVLKEDTELVITTASDLRTIEIDQSQLQQIIMNLTVNARDAMPRGGKLSIETYNVEALEEVGGVKEYSALVVSDNGIGMSEEIQARIFEPFFTTKEIGKGTGLGLSTVYGIVKQAKGWIELTSKLGQGTTFKLYFPSFKREYATMIPPMPSSEDLSGLGRILVVEDEESVRAVSSEILQRAGYEVIALGDPLEALSMIYNNQLPIDLVLSDIIMPKMRGTELAERLRSLRPDLKVLFMSGYTDDAIEQNLEFLQKPFTKIDLLSKVKSLLS